MSKYTTQVRWIVESNTMEYQDKTLLERIDFACPKIFNFSFPIWNEEYRLTLERKILMRYLNKEIGLETVGLWKLYLNERLNSIMPYYNNLYATTVKDYDYLADTIYNEGVNENLVRNGTNVSTDTSHSEGSGNQHNTTTGTMLNSDLPQTTLNNLDYGTQSTQTDDNSTATNSLTSDQNSNGNVKFNETNDNEITRTKTGASGTHTLNYMLKEYRDNLLNIDNMIIRELKDLFMLIY